MKTLSVNNNSVVFSGRLVVLNKLSKRPDSVIKNTKKRLNDVINEVNKKTYWTKNNLNLYIKQDYQKCNIDMIAKMESNKNVQSTVSIPITAKSPSSYIKAAKLALNNYKSEYDMEFFKQIKKEEKNEFRKMSFKEKFIYYKNNFMRGITDIS